MEQEQTRLPEQLSWSFRGLSALWSDSVQQEDAKQSTGNRQEEVSAAFRTTIYAPVAPSTESAARRRWTMRAWRWPRARRDLEARVSRPRPASSPSAENTERHPRPRAPQALEKCESRAGSEQRRSWKGKQARLKPIVRIWIRARSGVQRIGFGAHERAEDALRSLAEAIDSIRAQLDDFSDRHHRSELQLARVEAEYKQIQDQNLGGLRVDLRGRGAVPTGEFQDLRIRKAHSGDSSAHSCDGHGQRRCGGRIPHAPVRAWTK